MSEQTFDSNSPTATEALGEQLGRSLAPGTVVALYGDLGSGKTVFARGIAHGLGVSGPVASPTFNIVLEYPASRCVLYHIDLYRLADAHAAFDFGIDDYLGDPAAVTVIEWPERLAALLPAESVRVQISPLTQERRRIQMTNVAPLEQ
jgi:tRNA threonylcarbamoyladenosine biosynthesis protein TsaE